MITANWDANSEGETENHDHDDRDFGHDSER
jgi:hypothetical protein